MTKLQKTAFDLIASTENPKSKFYAEDIANLKRYYSKRSDADCLRVINNHRALAEMDMEAMTAKHCQLDGIFASDAGYR